MREFIEVRCPKEKMHGNYQNCGHILGGIDKNIVNHYVLFYCSSCPAFYIGHVDEDGYLNMKKVKSGTRIPFIKKYRIVEE